MIYVFNLQAKSPIRTLDELNVSEVVSSPYFPSIIERQENLTKADVSSSSYKPENDLPLGSIGGASDFNGGAVVEFGIRRRHHCFVITARARSFLYHQVLSFPHVFTFSYLLYSQFRITALD